MKRKDLCVLCGLVGEHRFEIKEGMTCLECYPKYRMNKLNQIKKSYGRIIGE